MSDLRPISAICADLQHLLTKSLRDSDAVDQIAEEVAIHPEGIKAVGLLIALLEKNKDWGSPGPVVHAVEKFFKKGYEALLLDSAARAPTSHTLWMVNRIANGVAKEQREQFLSVMRTTATRDDASDEVRATAKSFLEFQSKN